MTTVQELIDEPYFVGEKTISTLSVIHKASIFEQDNRTIGLEIK